MIEENQSGKGKILIVDDATATISMLNEALTSEGYYVFVATNGEKAIKRAELVLPDIILLDILMPKRDGYETCKILKSNDKTKNIPVIFMSALTDTFDKVKSFKAGAIDYITKPVEMEELLSRVNTHITLGRLQNELIELNESLEDKVQKRTEELKKSNVLLQNEIIDRKKAEETLKMSIKEKELILKELYHRTKNNMGVICGLLTLQSEFSNNDFLIQTLQKANDRIRSMALVHEKLYQSQDLSNISLNTYIQDLVNNLKITYIGNSDRLSITLDIFDNPITVSIDTAIPCGLIINELITNSLKHAFPNNAEGSIDIKLGFSNKEEIEFMVSDNGIGMPEGFKLENAKSLGLYLVKNLTEAQLHGEIRMIRDAYTGFLIKFKDLENKKRI